MIAQIARLLGIREDQVGGALKSDPDARRFLTRRGLLLGAVGAAVSVPVLAQLEPAALSVELSATLIISDGNICLPENRDVTLASEDDVVTLEFDGQYWREVDEDGNPIAQVKGWRHPDGSSIVIREASC